MTVKFEGKTIVLDSDADMTSRLMPYMPYHEAEEGDAYIFEMSAHGHDKKTNDSCIVYWEFQATKGDEPELDTYDYEHPSRVSWE